MKKDKFYTIYITIIVASLVVSGAIAAVVLFRPFYFWQVKALDIVNQSGYSLETITTAYNEMMDYCIGLSKSFTVGSLQFTEEGRLHFVDVKRLFFLDFGICIFSAINVAIYCYLKKRNKIFSLKLAGHSIGCNAAKGIVTTCICLVLIALPDFNAFFTLFHRVFFPGKDNWLFDPRYDQVINILPEAFFMNCAIAIAAIVFGVSFVLIIRDYKHVKNR